jgi:signal transduction histidine kinase
VAALPAHLLATLGSPWPTWLLLTMFVTNCFQVLIAATGIRWFNDAPARFDTLPRMIVFIIAAGLVAPLPASFLVAAAMNAALGEAYWLIWRARFFSNLLTVLVLCPAIVIAVASGSSWLREATRARKMEAAVLVGSLVLVSAWVFGPPIGGVAVTQGESVVVVLLPVILFAAVRFGTGGASVAMLLTTVGAMSAGVRGYGPFDGMANSPSEVVLELQIILTVVAIPVLCLSAVIAERRAAVLALAEQLRLEMVLSRLSAAFVHRSSDEMDPVLDASMRQVGQATGADRVALWHDVSPRGQVERYAWHTARSDRDLEGSPEEQFPWTIARLRQEDNVVFSRLEELPLAAARDVASFRRYGVRSAVIVPLVGGPRVRAALSLVAVSERRWRDGLVPWLRLVAEIFAGALARKDAEDALRASELSKSAILASLNSAVAVLDGAGRIIDANSRWTQAVAQSGGLAPPGLGIGQHLLDGLRLAGDEIAHGEEAAAGIADVLRDKRSEFAIEYSHRGAGSPQWFVMSVVPLDRMEGGAVVSCTEVTERKRAELDAQRTRHELAHCTRISTMGQLTASIAHELNQPLTGIITNARAGLRFLDAVPPNLGELREILHDIADDDKRAGEVIQRLRGLLRKEEPERVLLDLNDVVRDVARLLSSDAIIRNVTVTLELAPQPIFLPGDRVELQQVMLNLLLNAMEAVGEVDDGDPTITVTTTCPSAETAHVAIRDNGPGLRPGFDELIFEPFFTTKTTGMGMGLAIARSIVEWHSGVIWAVNHPQRGAVVHISLPVKPDS